MSSSRHHIRLRELMLLSRRCLEITALTALHGLRYAGCRLLYLIRTGPGKAMLRGVFLADLFEALGPTFIKIGQILSTRPDLLSPEAIAPLARLQDRVAPFTFRLIPDVIERSFGRPMEDLFEAFDETPVSSASIAQVHRAWLKDGREVAVKIQRPGIQAKVHGDLQILRGLARLFQRLPDLRLVPFEGLVDEFGSAVEQQLDFRLEADNNRSFRANFALMEQVRFPQLVEALCSDTVLTMEYFDGLQKLKELNFDPREQQEAARLGLQVLYKMIFIDGLIHGDMHPANMFFVPGPGVILLDTGLVARLVHDDLTAFIDFFLGLAGNDGSTCARVVYDTASYRAPSFDRATFETAMVALVNRHHALNAREFEVTRFAADLFATQRRHGIRGSTMFTMTIVALLVYEGIVKQLHPDLDFQREAMLFILRAQMRLTEPTGQGFRIDMSSF